MLASLIIGAGMFSLPYVTSKTGLLIGLFYLVGFTFLMSLTHLFYSDIVLAEKNDGRFISQSRRYLGKPGWWFGIIAILAGTTLTLTIYLVLSMSFSRFLFSDVSLQAAPVIFWILGSLAIVAGAKEIAGLDTLLTLFMIFLAGTVAFFSLRSGAPFLKIVPLWPVENSSLLFLPLGPFLFSLNGRAAIVSLKDYYNESRLDSRKMRKAIILGTFLAAGVYLLFIIGVIIIAAGLPAKDAIASLGGLPVHLRFMVGSLGIIAIFTSYIFLGLELKSIFEKDFGLEKRIALLATIIPPFLIYLSGEHDFINLVGATGGIFIAIESVLVIMMWEKLKSKKFLINKIIIILFVAGALYEIVKRIG